MDEKRFGALKEKARTRGVSDTEADELGKLYAEAEGKPYSHAQPKPDVFDKATLHPRGEIPFNRRKFRLRFRGTRSLEIGQTAAQAEETSREAGDERSLTR